MAARRLMYWGRPRKAATKTNPSSTGLSGNSIKKVKLRYPDENEANIDQYFAFARGSDGTHQLLDKRPNSVEFCEREKKKKLVKLFWKEYEKMKKERKDEDKQSKRLDMVTYKDMERKLKLPIYTKVAGPVSGVEVGDKFKNKVELRIVGLHSEYLSGIDYIQCLDGKLIATSVVAREGYSYKDEMERPDVLIYTGEGGGFGFVGKKKLAKDQELTWGNLALRNSMKEGTDVRVIRGVNNGSKLKTVFVYDGLYKVADCKSEIVGSGLVGRLVYKFRMERCPGQKAIAWDKYKY